MSYSDDEGIADLNATRFVFQDDTGHYAINAIAAVLLYVLGCFWLAAFAVFSATYFARVSAVFKDEEKA